ncbi:FAD-dependent oxidoreductase [Gryllotalpicola kribbensis]|uniref:FAD-dependent oxidoreductase n=1 Tax=Gryllotalpicola kribbensis TaxID=993084 RepID=UPI0031DCC1B5
MIGGGLGGVAAALAVARMGRTVVLTEESPWLGGQVTSQLVPPDEHPWIEDFGATASYREFRKRIRDYYRRNYSLSREAAADEHLNPGQGGVSVICHEPRVALAAIDEMIAPYRLDGTITVWLSSAPTAAITDGDSISAVDLVGPEGEHRLLTADRFIDATETGELLALAGVEHVIGAESRATTGELHAVDGPGDPLDQQAFTWCFAVDYLPDRDNTIDRPTDYERWRDYVPSFWPGPLLSWTDVHPITLEPRTENIFASAASPRGGKARDRWNYRRISSVGTFAPERYASDVSVVNWPQNDYWMGPLIGVDDASRERSLLESRQLSLSLLYWMQTEAPRYDGGTGYPGLRLRGDLAGGVDGLALRPYIRESRRIVAEFTVLEQHVGVEARAQLGLESGSELFADSVGVGSYRIDLHPSTGGAAGPRTYIDVANYPFQIPYGALLPVRVDNLLAGAKNIGTTHITNGCYRLHPVEWNIGEAAGAAAALSLDRRVPPRALRRGAALDDFQSLLASVHGVELEWPDDVRRTTT